MNINCQYTTETGALNCDLPFLEVVEVNGSDVYFNKLNTGSDFFLCFFLIVFLLVFVAKIIFDFLFGYVISIRKKYE
jgi:hypothetical protein